jgi:hypothetical protein
MTLSDRLLFILLITALLALPAFAQGPLSDEQPVPLDLAAGSITDEVTPDDPSNVYSLTLSEGDSIIFFLSSSEYIEIDLFPPTRTPQTSAPFRSRDPLGDIVLGPYTAPETGEYILEVGNPYGGLFSPASYKMNWFMPELMPIEPDAEVTIEMNEGEIAYFVFEAAVHENYDLRVMGENNIDTSAFWIWPTYATRSADQDGGRGLDPELEDEFIRYAGRQTIMIRAESGSGPVTVTVISDPLPRLSERPQTTALTVNAVGRFALEVIEGRPYAIIMSTTDPNAGRPTFAVLRDGFPIIQLSAEDSRNVTLNFTAPYTGLMAVEFVDNFTVDRRVVPYEVTGFEAFPG